MLIAQTETAIQSYRALCAAGEDVDQRMFILAFITNRGGDWAIGEIAQATGMDNSAVSRAVNELLYKTKQLIEAPRRKSWVSNKTIRPVMLPPEQGEMFQ